MVPLPHQQRVRRAVLVWLVMAVTIGVAVAALGASTANAPAVEESEAVETDSLAYDLVADYDTVATTSASPADETATTPLDAAPDATVATIAPATTAAPTTVAPTTAAPAAVETTTSPVEASPATTVAAPAPAVVPSASNSDDIAFMECVKHRESRGDYTAVDTTGSGAGGAYQFMPVTWDNTARHAGRYDLVGVHPSQASPADQDAMFWHLLGWYGRSPWNGPGC